MEYQSSLEKQERCQNCNHLYFKNLKIWDGQFCSIDCKTNHNYIQSEILPHINDIFEDSLIDLISIDFSDSSLAYELDQSLYSKIQIKSMNNIYKKHNNNNVYNSL